MNIPPVDLIAGRPAGSLRRDPMTGQWDISDGGYIPGGGPMGRLERGLAASGERIASGESATM